jgi:hypothetical protein
MFESKFGRLVIFRLGGLLLLVFALGSAGATEREQKPKEKGPKSLVVIRLSSNPPTSVAKLLRAVIKDCSVEPVEKLSCIVFEADETTARRVRAIVDRLELAAESGETFLALEWLSILHNEPNPLCKQGFDGPRKSKK